MIHYMVLARAMNVRGTKKLAIALVSAREDHLRPVDPRGTCL